MLKWSGDNFRPAFATIGALQAAIPNATLLALTATLTEADAGRLSTSLHMVKPIVIKKSPKRFVCLRQVN